MKRLLLMIVLINTSTVLFAQKNDMDAVKQVLKAYASSIEKLDTAGVTKLFVKDSKIFEQGSDEGSIAHYLEHHLGPEMKEIYILQIQ